MSANAANASLAPNVVDLPSLVLRLSLARGLDEIMAAIRTGARRLSGADGVTFVLRDGEYCFYADEDAISPLWKGRRFPVETCISGWAMTHRQPVVIEDVYQDQRIPQDAYRLTFVHSLLMVPVRAEDPVAAIGAYWGKRHRASTQEVAVMQAIANAAAVAMTNVALYHSLEQRAAEAEHQARELAKMMAELERVAEQKSRFLAACSHDLRQPFQAMRLFHAVLAARAPEADRDVIDRLGDAMTHGEDLLKALLDVSTIDSGLTEPARSTFPLDDVFERIRVTFAAQAEDKGLRFRVVPTRQQVDSDPILLARIVGNLVANAIRYTERGSILLGARRRGEHASIEVWDTGIGIPSCHLDDIFTDFYQVGNTERDKRQGIGLGLGIVRRLADLLGHPITARSMVGRGSMFATRVPVVG